jgi:uncharacterized protein involved in exopolysaccharide biosynthesis
MRNPDLNPSMPTREAPPKVVESGLFDLVLMCLSHGRMLILLPLAVGAVVYGLAMLLPKTYTSGAIIQLPANNPKFTPPQVASILTSPVVLDPVIEKLNLTPDLNRDLARQELAKRVRAASGRDQLIKLDVLGETPEEAQVTANAVLDSWLRSTVPSAREQADMKRKLEVATNGYDTVQKALKQLLLENPSSVSRRESGLSAVSIGELGDRYFDQVLSFPHEMEGLPREVIRQAPTLPIEPIKPKKGMLAMMAALLTLAGILAAFGLRHLLDVAESIPQRAAKLHRLQAALPQLRRRASDRTDV